MIALRLMTIAALAFSSFSSLKSEIVEIPEIKCESIEREKHWEYTGHQLTCHFHTPPDYEFFKFSSQGLESVTALDYCYRNKNVAKLPIKVSESFPQLITYRAQECSIEKLAKKNFDGLHRLLQLYFSGNKISVIEPGSFDDLTALNQLALSKFGCKVPSE